MRYNDELMRYQEEAEEQFDDYDGGLMTHDGYDDEFEEYEEEGDFDDDGYVDESYGDEFEDEDYDDYRASGRTKRIDPNDRTLTIVVQNTSDQAHKAFLFGANRELPQNDGVTVTVEESSHKEVREESKANPFKIRGVKYSVSSPLQFDNVLKIINRTASGSNTTQVWQPRNASSPQNFNGLLVDSEDFEFFATGQNSIEFTIDAKTKCVFTFTVRARTNMGNLLEGNNVAELSKVPRTTGLPQIDLLRRRQGAYRPRPKRRAIRTRRVVRKARPRKVIPTSRLKPRR